MGCKASKAKQGSPQGQPEPEIKQDVTDALAVEEPGDFLANLLKEAKEEKAAADALVLARQHEEEQKLAQQKEEEIARQKEETFARLKKEEVARKKAEALALEKEEQERQLQSLKLATEIATRSLNLGVCAATVAIEEKRVEDEASERQQLKKTLVSVFEKELETLEWDVDLFKEDAVAGLAQGLIVNHLNIADFITAMDLDGDEMLAAGEFSNGILALGLPIDIEAIEQLFADIDENGDGKLSYLELSSMRKSHLEQNESSLRRYLSNELTIMKPPSSPPPPPT
eukprot:m.47295 g.47295  ORF g.47295 m.47295 type:complete len:285 (-) comp20458_c2_seq1:37-891(-)